MSEIRELIIKKEHVFISEKNISLYKKNLTKKENNP